MVETSVPCVIILTSRERDVGGFTRARVCITIGAIRSAIGALILWASQEARRLGEDNIVLTRTQVVEGIRAVSACRCTIELFVIAGFIERDRDTLNTEFAIILHAVSIRVIPHQVTQRSISRNVSKVYVIIRFTRG